MAQHKHHATTGRRRWPWLAAGGATLAAVAVVAVAVGSAGSGGSSGSSPVEHPLAVPAAKAAAQQATVAHARAELVAQLAAAVTVAPAAGATSVAPDTQVVVTTSRGRLSDVRAVSIAGAPLVGTVMAGSMQWRSAAPLAVGAGYAVTGAIVAPSGVRAPFRTTFTTLTPTETVTNTLYPLDGQVVGVGQPVVVRFDHEVSTAAERASVLAHLTVAESRPVPGGWYWFSDYELHFRPEVYWPSGERISVTSDLDGWDAGAGRWGGGHVNVQFSTGASHVAVAHLDTHVMTVTDNGAVVATYPISAGSTVYPTMDGVHIALDKESVVHMVSSTVGIPVHSSSGYDEYVYSDVHISDSGEYVHAAPWSEYAQGSRNVSHGCINLAPSNAAAFMAFSQIGDVVEVVGGTRPPATGDHGVMDWSTPWNQWTAGKVVPLAPAA